MRDAWVKLRYKLEVSASRFRYCPVNINPPLWRILPAPDAIRASPMSPAPLFKSTSYTSILHRDRCAPHAIAVSLGTQDVNYGGFVRDIELT